MEREEFLEAMKSQEFGIEIEFSFISRIRAEEVIDDVLHSSDMIDGLGRQWEIYRDGSIVPRKRNVDGHIVHASDDYRVEFVSPILGYDDIPLLQELIRALRKAGAEPSDLCGIHIHVGEAGHTPQSLRNLLNLFMQKEEIFIEAFQIPSNRLFRYCNTVDEGLISIINRRKPKTLYKLREYWDEETGTRYKMVNLDSFFSKKGIEFRFFNTTMHAGIVRAYIVFCLALSQKAKMMNRAVPRKSNLENNRYEFRNFLNRLYLSGDEFKNVRKHLLKHVSGDSSFHNPEDYGRRRLNQNL